MTEGPFRYKSRRSPVPLSELEEALLVAAGVGFSGIALWDQSRPLPYRTTVGRTFPSTCGGRRTALFLTNDHGVYVIDPAGGSAGAPRELNAPNEREKILTLYRDHRRELNRGRLDIPRQVPPFSGHNLWASNMPSSTLFMPVCDVSFSLIGLIAQFVDHKLERFAPKHRGGMNVVDDRHGFRPAGTERWLDSGFLDEDQVLLVVIHRQDASTSLLGFHVPSGFPGHSSGAKFRIVRNSSRGLYGLAKYAVAPASFAFFSSPLIAKEVIVMIGM